MTETKNQAFHRLATKRSENVIEAMRIFGQLASPNYDFTRDEALAYLGQIVEAAQAMEMRFRESKQWGPEDEPEVIEEEPSPFTQISLDAIANSELISEAPIERRRSPTVSELIQEASKGQSKELLASDLVLIQYQVIEGLMEKIQRIEANVA